MRNHLTLGFHAVVQARFALQGLGIIRANPGRIRVQMNQVVLTADSEHRRFGMGGLVFSRCFKRHSASYYGQTDEGVSAGGLACFT